MSLFQVFATSPDNVLSGFVSEATNVILRIRDYNSSELLFDISRKNVSQHFIMDWQSSAVTVEIQFQGYWVSKRVKIFLTSRPSKFSSFVNTENRSCLILTNYYIQYQGRRVKGSVGWGLEHPSHQVQSAKYALTCTPSHTHY